MPIRTHRTPCLLAPLLLAMLAGPALAQPTPLDDAECRAVVTRLAELLNERYVFPDVAEQCAEHLEAELNAGAYDDLSDAEAFARRLTESLQSVSQDKHMRVQVRPPDRVSMQRENPVRARARDAARRRQQNFGFAKVELLEGNVGYLDMRYFAGTPLA